MSQRYHGTACKTCRRRGRKCTKELPHCQSCRLKGLECEGYTLRWAGLASRGHLAGKKTLAGIQSPQKLGSRRTIQVPEDLSETRFITQQHQDLNNTTLQPPVDEFLVVDDDDLNEISISHRSPYQSGDITALNFDLDFGQSEEVSARTLDYHVGLVEAHSPTLEAVLPTTLLDPYNVPFELKFILNYHLLEVAPRLCVDNATFKNPYTQYIIPLAVQKPPLLYACAALAACHFSVRLSDQNFLVDCLRFRGKAMRRLQEQLWSEQSAKDEGNLATVLMLTLTDMCLGGFSNFDAHFRAARKLIDLRGNSRTQDTFVEQYIGWLDIMSAASNHRRPLFSSDDVLKLIGPSNEWSHDVFPCPPDQFAVISQVVELYKSQDDPRNPNAAMLEQIAQKKTALLTQPMHVERGIPWMHLTEAYRHAIVLYMVRLFHCDVDEDEINWLTQSVFYHAKSIPASTGWSAQLLWPLFHAGLEIRDERRMKWIRDRSIDMQFSGGFGNVQTAMSILERVWNSGSRPDYMSLLSEDGVTNMLVV